MRRLTQSATLTAVSLAIATILLELGLRLFTPFPITENSNQKNHPRLAYTLSPSLSDVDDFGFRNAPNSFKEATVAILGDSHTYGENVTAENNLPSILARMTGRKVYNFGIGSYGIYQYRALLDEVLQHSFEEVILAFYPANDLAFDCRVLRTSYWRTYVKRNGLRVPACTVPGRREGADPETRTRPSIRAILSRTATVQILKDLRKRYLEPPPSNEAIDTTEYFWLDGNQSVRRRRVLAHARNTDLEDPDVRMNYDNSLIFFTEFKERLSAESVEFAVIVVPSKERVLSEWMKRRARDVAEEFELLVSNETVLTRKYESFFADNDIVYVDAVSEMVFALAQAVDDGAPFYPLNNGHPLSAGYEAYARAAFKAYTDSSRKQ